VPEPESGNVQVVVRKRRRTRRHRRNRAVHRWLATLSIALVTAAVSTFALMHFSPSLFHSNQSTAAALQRYELTHEGVATVNQILSQAQPARPVYPYSVVPGGVEDAKELKWVAEHDPIVGAHYAGFDYARARLVRLTLARTAYISYRIGNKIYWTRRRITLHKGETVITDGRMTARTRCANRVEETPQQAEASPVEPTPEAFEQPGEGIAMQSTPPAFQSALLNRPPLPGLEPVAPLTIYDPFTAGNVVSLSPPPLPEGLCGPIKKKKGATGIEVPVESGKKKKTGSGPCGTVGTPGTVPEPGTWLLFASGLAAIGWHARRKLCRV